MFKKKYRIREDKNWDERFSFRYYFEVKYKVFPVWQWLHRSDNLDKIKHHFKLYTEANSNIIEESDWI